MKINSITEKYYTCFGKIVLPSCLSSHSTRLEGHALDASFAHKLSVLDLLRTSYKCTPFFLLLVVVAKPNKICLEGI